jgi:hypothetical protein
MDNAFFYPPLNKVHAKGAKKKNATFGAKGINGCDRAWAFTFIPFSQKFTQRAQRRKNAELAEKN